MYWRHGIEFQIKQHINSSAENLLHLEYMPYVVIFCYYRCRYKVKILFLKNTSNILRFCSDEVEKQIKFCQLEITIFYL